MKTYILKCLLLLPFLSEAFIRKPNTFVTKLSGFNTCLLPSRAYLQKSHMIMSVSKNSHDNKNKSKVYKMEYSNEDDTDWLFKPRYAFGLNEFNMIFIRLYIYLVIIFNIITIIISRQH